jgi:heme exporter protein B
MIRVLRAAWLVARKDLVVESRSRELVYTTLFLAVACVLIFAFGLVVDGRAPEEASGAVLWIAMIFSGTLALGRTFERERESETLRALILSPAERPAVFLGKLTGLLLLMTAVEVVVVLLVALFFDAPVFRAPWLFLGLLVSGTVGFASVGTLFAAMLMRARSRDVLLPVILYPIVIPVVIAGVRGTSALLAAEPDFGMSGMWLSMLVFFDVVFVTLALWTFGPIMSEG